MNNPKDQEMPVITPEQEHVISRSEIESLIYLLEDPDPVVQEHVNGRLRHLGDKAIPILDELSGKTENEASRDHIQGIIRRITSSSIEHEFVSLIENGVETLEELERGIFILSRLERPTIDEAHYRTRLDQMAESLKAKLELTTSVPVHQIVARHIFEREDFKGDTNEYFNPSNSYIHRVMERRKGIPISLAMVVLFVARRVNLHFEGINMPMHFLLKFSGSSGTIYLDPYNNGEEVSLDQCAYFLKKNGIQPNKNHFEPAAPSEMLARTLRNLINSYEKRDDQENANQHKRLLGLLEASRQHVK